MELVGWPGRLGRAAGSRSDKKPRHPRSSRCKPSLSEDHPVAGQVMALYWLRYEVPGKLPASAW